MVSRNISDVDVRTVIQNGEVIKEYPDDKPYPSKLLFAMVGYRPIHLVIGKIQETGECIVITVYIAGEDIWEPDFKTKKK